MRRLLITTFALLPLAFGCRWGPKLSTFEPARTPYGIQSQIDVRAPSAGEVELIGELIVVGDSSIVLLSSGQIVDVAYEYVRRARFEDKNALQFGAGRAPNSKTMESLRLLSRFPQGLTAEMQARLLAITGQSEIEVVE